MRITKAIAINRPAAALYMRWRDVEQLPRFMRQLERVTPLSDTLSHWVMRTDEEPLEWDAKIVEDRPDERIAWRSVEGADVDHRVTVSFQDWADRGAIVTFTLQYDQPGGRIGRLAAKLFGKESTPDIMTDLRRFKQLMEVGEILTTEGQPAGRERGATPTSVDVARRLV